MCGGLILQKLSIEIEYVSTIMALFDPGLIYILVVLIALFVISLKNGEKRATYCT